MRGIAAAMLTAMLVTGSTEAADAEEFERFEYAQIHMGVDFQIVLYAPSKQVANQAANAAFQRIAEINSICSDYDRTSELMRLCSTAKRNEPKPISEDLYLVLRRAAAISELSNGVFDPTIGPMVRLWRRARSLKELPRPSRLAEVRNRVGSNKIHLNNQSRTVTFLADKMWLDLGGIAKGYATDAALGVLAKHGITRALIDGSGDIRVGAPPPGKPGWKIAVAPLSKNEKTREYLVLADAAVATSGDAEQFIEFDGIRYSHIIDPRTGLGVTRRSSVTIVAPTGWQADALASAISVAGPSKGITMINRIQHAEARVAHFVNETITESCSPGWKSLTSRSDCANE